MTILTLGYSFEEKLNDINIIDGDIAAYSDGFKILLKEIEREFREDIQVLTDIKELNHEGLQLLNQKIKKFNTDFDKLNNLYYDKNYFDDGELKQLFLSISRQAHKVENISHKHLYLNQPATQTPDYIKEGLAKFSRETISKKLTPKN
jgi:hypothetical protein